MAAYQRIHTEAQFDALFSTWPNVGPTVKWARDPVTLERKPFHAVGPNRKTACGLTVPPVAKVSMAAWGDITCVNCKLTWTVR